MKNSIKSLVPHFIALLIFLISSIIYFYPQIQGKVLQQSDYIQYQGMANETNTFKKETGELSLWTNSMFGGMPTYQINAPQKKNLNKYIKKALSLGFSKGIGYFIMGMISFYILLIAFKVNPWLAIIGSIAFAFSTNNIVLLDTGHHTKLQTVLASAPIIAGVVFAYRGKYILGAVIFCLFMSINLLSNHPQMTYYLAMCLGIFVLIQLYQDWKGKNLIGFTKASGALLLAMIIALGTSASKLITTYEYSEATMRGSSILESQNQNPQSSSETDGLAWDYAMNWSNGSIDLLSSFIPGVVGGSSNEKLDSKSAVGRDLAQRGANVRNGVDGPLYWGGLPSTSGPIYFGAFVFFLFIFGAFVVKGNFKWWLVSSVALLMLLSLGKNLEWFNRLFFDYFPLFNKFRTPNSILSVAVIFIPFLGFLGAQKLLKGDYDKDKITKALYISVGSVGGICLLLGLLGPSLFSFDNPSDAQYQQYGYNIDAILKDRASFLRADSLRSFLFIGLGGLSIWLFIKSKISAKILLISFALLTLFDLWSVGKRYISNDDYQPERVTQQNFAPRPVDNQILADQDPHYRVMDLSVNTFNSSAASYFHKSIGGYHAAKLQRYQDLIDRHLGRSNQNVLNMLNTKYFIIPDQQRNPMVQPNPAALGNAWFVNDIQMVETANAEIDALTSFDPLGDVIVHREFESYIGGFTPNKEGSIRLTDYKPNALTYLSNTNSEQFAVFSEIWYGPNKGWNAYVDGEEVEHIRVNYALRGMKVPAGQHEIKFVFNPKSYWLGENISLFSSLLLIIGLLFYFWKFVLPKMKEKKKASVKTEKKNPVTSSKKKRRPKK